MEFKGVYEILNTVNGKRYIGSSKELYTREKTHWRNLKEGKHPNRYLQFAVNKYGIENFEFNILEYCEVEYLFILEQWYLDNEEWHYNLKDKAIGGTIIHVDARQFETEDIIEIFELTLLGFTRKEISEYFECGITTIWHIINRKTYQEIELPKGLFENVTKAMNQRRHGKKLDCEQVLEIRSLHSLGGYTHAKLGKDFGICRSQVTSLINFKSYKECSK